MIVGILGGGQLGMMLAEELHNLNAKVICLDPNPTCPASFVCDEVIVAEYNDLNGLKELGMKADVITYEFENVNANHLKHLNENYNMKQGISVLFDSQNRIREKTIANQFGLNTPKFYPINTLEDLEKGIQFLGFPCVYKTATMGYDGHGQILLKEAKDIQQVKRYLDQEGILEEYVSYDFETSIIMVRSIDKIIHFPLTKNIHRKGILDLVVADREEPIFKKIINASYQFMKQANYYGILTIEYFVKGNQFYFNEMAPRPHNSGHYTIEGCTTNQYRELARYLLDQPLENPKLISPTIMKNILGNDLENIKDLNKSEKIHIHMYHKEEMRPTRKMGHITFSNLKYEEYVHNYKSVLDKE
ncbi:MAG: 5-(carboxyamino)imidazole ribonucleotide synthase [Anaeroplasmataceae bacterium]|nr:5-(carboxyamino)imidazole ribonucleotide synthase [Anaeroplasmataceae bacterium]